MRSRCRPRLLPTPIADPIAQHEHGIDVLPMPAHARPFEACFDDELVGTFHAASANGPAWLLGRRVLRADLAALVAADLPYGQCLDLGPFAPDQMHHRSIPTHRLFLRSLWRWGRFLLEPFHLRLAH